MTPPGVDAAAAALADVRHTPYWLDEPGGPTPRRPLRRRRDRRPAVVGGGYTGLWTALLAKERDPGRDVVLLEGRDRAAGRRRGRNGGFCAASLTHGLAQRPATASPTRWRRWSGSAGRTSTASRRPSRGTASTATSSAPASSPSRPRRSQADDLRELPALGESVGGRRWSCSTRDAGARARSTRRPTSAGCWDRDGVRHGRPGPAGLGAAARPACDARRADLRGHAGHRAASARRRRARCARRTAGCAARRVALGTNAFPPLLRRLRPYVVPVYDYALMTEPLTAEQRAAIGWARPAGHRRRRQPVPLLPAHRRRPDPVGRLRRDLPLRRPHRRRLRAAPGDVPPAGRALLRDVPAARGAALHPPLGRRHRHLHPVLRVLRHRARRRGRPTRRLHRARRRAPPGSAPRCCSTCSTARDTERTALEMVRAQAAAVPARAAALGRHRAHPPRGRGPTPNGGRRDLWLRTLDRSASASTPERSRHDQVRRHVRPGRHLPRRRPVRPRRTRRRSPAPTWWSSARRSTAAPRTGPAPGSGRRRSGRPTTSAHDGSRPHLALRVDALRDLRVRRRR